MNIKATLRGRVSVVPVELVAVILYTIVGLEVDVDDSPPDDVTNDKAACS